MIHLENCGQSLNLRYLKKKHPKDADYFFKCLCAGGKLILFQQQKNILILVRHIFLCQTGKEGAGGGMKNKAPMKSYFLYMLLKRI